MQYYNNNQFVFAVLFVWVYVNLIYNGIHRPKSYGNTKVII